jgi:transcriptional regulator with XRE-family HTH domain
LRAIRDVLQEDMILARVVDNVGDATELRLSQLHENIHRNGYKPFELAEEFDALMKDNGWTQDELAAKVGVSKSWASKRLSLLKAPKEIQDAIRSGELAETDYYNNKEVIKAEVATKKAKPEGAEASSEKPKTVALPWTNAVQLAEWVVEHAKRVGLKDLEISPEPTKKELVAILARVDEVRGAA